MALAAGSVGQMAGVSVLGKVIRECNTALVEGPLIAAERIVDLMLKLTDKFSEVLQQWKTAGGDGYTEADMDELLTGVQSSLFGMIAQRQEVSAQIEVASQESAAKHFAWRLALGYGVDGLTGEGGLDSVTDTTRGSAVRASYRYTAASMAPDTAQWAVIGAAIGETPPTLGQLLGAAYKVLMDSEKVDVSTQVPTG